MMRLGHTVLPTFCPVSSSRHSSSDDSVGKDGRFSELLSAILFMTVVLRTRNKCMRTNTKIVDTAVDTENKNSEPKTI